MLTKLQQASNRKGVESELRTVSFRHCRKGRGSVKASASGIGVHEGLPSGAGLGRREARRQGLGTARVPNDKKNG